MTAQWLRLQVQVSQLNAKHEAFVSMMARLAPASESLESAVSTSTQHKTERYDAIDIFATDVIRKS